MKADYVQADETTTPVINKETHKAAKEYLWFIECLQLIESIFCLANHFVSIMSSGPQGR